jgi:hypothetical protein
LSSVFSVAKTAIASILGRRKNWCCSKVDEPTLTWKLSYETPADYAGHKVKVRAKLITDADEDGDGYYTVLGIKGYRNGDKITGLYPAGTSIPGNSPFSGDNLIAYEQAMASPQLTGNGLQFSIAGGGYSNVFFASFLETPGYLEFHSLPPYPEGPMAPNSESYVLFQASPIF